MKHRLPRRYDAVTKTLRELMETGNNRVKESAAMRLSEIYLEHDRSCERKEIARARAESRLEIAALEKAGVSTPESVEQPAESVDAGATMSTDIKTQVDAYLLRTIGK